LDFLGSQIDPLLLLALVLGIIGTLGTVLTLVANVQQIWDRLRAKSRRQDSEVKGIFQGLIPFFKSYSSGSMQNPWDFLREAYARKDKILALSLTLKKRVPKIEKQLTELMDLLNKTTYFRYGGPTNPGPPDIDSDQKFKRLVIEITKSMDEWLSKHV
jgi:hypothetical protein